MEIQNQDLTQLSLSLINSTTNQAIGIAVMKKAMDAQATAAAAMLEALPPVSAPNLPSHLGNTVNTTA